MNTLAAKTGGSKLVKDGEGFVLLGGPLEGSADVLLIVRAASADEVRARLAKDPWEGTSLLRTVRVAPWNLRLGSL